MKTHFFPPYAGISKTKNSLQIDAAPEALLSKIPEWGLSREGKTSALSISPPAVMEATFLVSVVEK